MSAVLASIPSPPTGVYHVGPFTIHMYGVMLLLAIAAAIGLTVRRWVRFGGERDLVFRVGIWGVIAGIVGARLYHDVTSWSQDPGIHNTWYGPFAVWQGGLGIWGAIPAGALAGAWIIRRSGNSVRLFMDAVAPGLLLAQGIGRLGNWWNQELYGGATNLPWALEIHGKGPGHLYHPTFLYELVWDLLGVLVLLFVDRRFRLRRPGLLVLYVSWYTAFRTYEEVLRIDPSTYVGGMRLNFWVSLSIFLLSTAFFVWWQFVRTPADERPPAPRKPRPLPEGPRMSVPKGRVR